MNVKEAILKRCAYRSLDDVDIQKELIDDLATSAGLAPSCFNYQPWQFVFVYEEGILNKLKNEALNRGNAWAKNASMIIAVFSKQELDCDIRGRPYYLFDTGLATGFLILRATELGLVAHPIAGYKAILKVLEDMMVIALIVVGKQSLQAKDILSDE